MPLLWMPEEELRALQAVLTRKERVNWDAYDRAKQYLIQPRPAPVETSYPEPQTVAR